MMLISRVGSRQYMLVYHLIYWELEHMLVIHCWSESSPALLIHRISLMYTQYIQIIIHALQCSLVLDPADCNGEFYCQLAVTRDLRGAD